MYAWFLLLLPGCLLANSIQNGEKVLTMTYDVPILPDEVTMDVHINLQDQIIRFHMLEQGNLADVETIEDYETGFAASRVNDDENCFIRFINRTIEEAIQEAEKLAASGPQKPLGEEEVMAIPADDAGDWVGERILNFCGDYSIYKLVRTEDQIEAESKALGAQDSDLENRQTSVAFTKCFFFFFIFKCITTTITIPTGTTIVFFLFG